MWQPASFYYGYRAPDLPLILGLFQLAGDDFYLRHALRHHVPHDVDEAHGRQALAALEQQGEGTRGLIPLVVAADPVECTHDVFTRVDLARPRGLGRLSVRLGDPAVANAPLGHFGGLPFLEARKNQ